ncbi:hypothetical protein A2G96_04745 [Cupriavidus nantongensis]|uniref:Uncharacterized protein n=1 Tax=Cupriavidus nantongensis TaxID=1796606 RepID=A0A142JG90_9BURK|nr:hypothetical protein A2G96_04745 [Cupriavidus nantongensis]
MCRRFCAERMSRIALHTVPLAELTTKRSGFVMAHRALPGQGGPARGVSGEKRARMALAWQTSLETRVNLKVMRARTRIGS